METLGEYFTFLCLHSYKCENVMYQRSISAINGINKPKIHIFFLINIYSLAVFTYILSI